MIVKATVTAALIAVVGVLGIDAYNQGAAFVLDGAATSQAQAYARAARLNATSQGRTELLPEDLAAVATDYAPEHADTAPHFDGTRLVLDGSVEGECRTVSIGAQGEPVVGTC